MASEREAREAMAYVAMVLADLIEENRHQFVGGDALGETRVKALHKARAVLNPPAATPRGGSPYDAAKNRRPRG